jgi:hypothetical protein
MPLPKEQNSREMEAAIKSFKDWRSTREKKCRIPDRLWKIAARLSHRYPINIICKNLGLNWGDFKKKNDSTSPSPRCAIELTKPDGTVMRIFASHDSPLNLLELFKIFLGTGRKTK